MQRSLDRDAPEREAIAAHSLYIAALAYAERVRHKISNAAPGATERDLLIAGSELDRQHAALRNILDALGYVPRGFIARLPPEPGTDV